MRGKREKLFFIKQAIGFSFLNQLIVNSMVFNADTGCTKIN